MPSPTRPIDAVLLDMDGTILNSIKAAERIWAAWAVRHGIDVEAFLPTIHGVQSVDTIRRANIAGVDPVAEAAAITQAEIEEVEGIEEIAGAAAFLAALPAARWGIVTAAPRALALHRIEAAGLPVPPLLIAAEDVACGKPAPDCFHLAAERLGTKTDKCLVIEDSAAGIAAAVSAGAMVLVVTATHHTPTETGHPAIVDYDDLTLERLPDGSLSIGRTSDVASPSGVMNWLLRAGPV
ncbi:HAD-IA family hydrolase [Corticibacterium sp. UT-5YL-CI-8]|nr:HAD-IA family hydrolase [Tianweitania sp. UT-5YL-CI-8]